MAGTTFNLAVVEKRVSRFLGAVTMLIAVSACEPDSPTGMLPVGEVGLAKGGGGGGGSGGGTVAPTVTAADPAFAVRDTTIDVTIFGSGFTTGAKATWSLAGDTGLVHVKSTKVVASDRLVARIEVPATAPVAVYDVEVTLSNGKKGVGAEMFEVQLGDPAAAFWFPLDDATLGLRSDHQFVSGTSSVYAQGVCGVNSKIFATGSASNSGDAIMHTNNPRSSDRKCALWPRTVTIEYAPGDVESSTVFINVREIANTTYQIPVGTTVRRALLIGETRCDGLRFIAATDGIETGADSVNVTRVDASTWLVQTAPSPDNKAYCRATGALYNIAARFTVVSNAPLP
jgi:hypothetical protein